MLYRLVTAKNGQDRINRLRIIETLLSSSSVCIISIVRIFQVLEYSLADVTYNDVDFAIWSGIELAIATLSTCVPTMRPLLDCVCGRRSRSSFAPSSFLHASFLRNISFRNGPGVPQQSSSHPPDGTRRSNFWRLGREECLSTQDKAKSTVTVEEKEEGGSKVQMPLSELELRRDGITVKKEWDVDCCECWVREVEGLDLRSCEWSGSKPGLKQESELQEVV